ncbi:MAG: SIR2 family protein [Saprospiraceae bacterium]|nr:SIR2 family protein [Saprospiraceae bacterium]
MVERWRNELKEADVNDLNDWLKEHNIDENDLASHYSKIFDKRFELSKKDGFAFLEKKMENIEPSCGYSVLAQILAEGKHNVVITTNFDSLTEDALFIYTQKKPLVVGHASLADYISTNLSRPLIVKIHHDLFLSPKNSVQEVVKMDNNFSKNLRDIFKYYTPLVIGYGGNDGSLMSFLEELDHIEEGIFWFYMEGNKPKDLSL